jgi:hypothetical protein
MQRCASSSATWIGQQQLWFGQREAVLLRDPDDLHEKLALAVNIRQLDPLPTDPRRLSAALRHPDCR